MKTPGSLVRKELPSTIRRQAGAPRTFEFMISTGAVDRENDTLNPQGWRLAEFTANPVVLFAHRYDEPPIGRATDVRVMGGALHASVEFPEPGVYDKADTIRRLVEEGFLRATSVGFKPERWVYNERRGGIDYLEQTLLEFSVVSVPANAHALLVGPAKTLDRAKLNEFFRTPRGSDLVLVDPDQVRVVCRDVLKSQVAQAVRGHRPVLLIDEPEPWLVDLGGGQVREIKPRAFAAAFGQVVGDLVGREMRQALNRLRGRVD